MKFDELVFHDSNLKDLSFSITDGKKCEVTIKVEICKDISISMERMPILIKFFDVANLVFAVNVYEMLLNETAGNVSNAYSKVKLKNLHNKFDSTYHIKKQLQNFRIYLCDGYLEIIAKGCRISRGVPGTRTEFRKGMGNDEER